MTGRCASSTEISSLAGPLAVVLLLCLLLAGCNDAEAVRIGFCGSLTGRGADAGVAGRDAVILAVEQRNAQGGVAGRPLELAVRNDANNPERGLLMDQELLDLPVAAVIGHMTSSLSQPSIKLFNQRKTPLISPTASYTPLGGQDDYFWRMRPNNAMFATVVARHARDELGLRNMAAVVDLSNKLYTRDWMTAFGREFSSGGGGLLQIMEIDGMEGGYAGALARNMLATKPDGVVLAANAVDAALLCQQLRKLGFKGQIYVAGWAFSPALLQQGGAAVEGVITAEIRDTERAKPRREDFRREFARRFGYIPTPTSLHSYNAALFLFQGLELSLGQGLDLKQALVSIKTVDGLQGPIAMDAFGDARADVGLQTVRGGKLIDLPPPAPAQPGAKPPMTK